MVVAVLPLVVAEKSGMNVTVAVLWWRWRGCGRSGKVRREAVVEGQGERE